MGIQSQYDQSVNVGEDRGHTFPGGIDNTLQNVRKDATKHPSVTIHRLVKDKPPEPHGSDISPCSILDRTATKSWTLGAISTPFREIGTSKKRVSILLRGGCRGKVVFGVKTVQSRVIVKKKIATRLQNLGKTTRTCMSLYPRPRGKVSTFTVNTASSQKKKIIPLEPACLQGQIKPPLDKCKSLTTNYFSIGILATR